MQPERLDKLISQRLCISRKEARQKIKEGRVSLCGKALLSAEQKIEPGITGLTADGKPVMTAAYVYIMMNKPAGVLSASRDSKARTVVDLVPEEYRTKGLFPAGRLDKDTTGFMLITNDGELAHRLLSPKNKVEKIYRAQLDGPVDRDMIEAFARGITLRDGTAFLPAKLVGIHPTRNRRGYRPQSPVGLRDIEDDVPYMPFTAKITIHEGKYHQIKRMFSACGREVLALERLRIGGLALDPDLAPGACKLLGGEEIHLLLKNTAKNCL